MSTPTSPSTHPVSITALPAACGDCLVVEYASAEGNHRILVDGGLKSKYEIGLGPFLGALGEAPARFDLVVVSHVDRDHIDGVIEALRHGHLAYDDIWFNGRDELEVALEGRKRGVRQGDQLDALIPAKSRNRVVAGDALRVPSTGPVPFDLPGGARVTLLAPTIDRLQRLFDKWPEPARVVEDPTEDLLSALDDPRTRGPGEFGGDGSVANGSSIAILLEVSGVSLLLAGDAFAPDLVTSITELLAERGTPKLRVDLFKLSHHGSRQNMTDALLDLIEPGAILVCTDGSKFHHPDADALGKAREHYPDVPIHFTDINDHIRERAATIGEQPPAAVPLRLGFGTPS